MCVCVCVHACSRGDSQWSAVITTNTTPQKRPPLTCTGLPSKVHLKGHRLLPLPLSRHTGPWMVLPSEWRWRWRWISCGVSHSRTPLFPIFRGSRTPTLTLTPPLVPCEFPPHPGNSSAVRGAVGALYSVWFSFFLFFFFFRCPHHLFFSVSPPPSRNSRLILIYGQPGGAIPPWHWGLSSPPQQAARRDERGENDTIFPTQQHQRAILSPRAAFQEGQVPPVVAAHSRNWCWANWRAVATHSLMATP